MRSATCSEYVRWHIDPLWRDDEQRIIREIGTWARDAVLGDEVTAAIIAAAPATVLGNSYSVLVKMLCCGRWKSPSRTALRWPPGETSASCTAWATPLRCRMARCVRCASWRRFPSPTGTGVTAQRRKRHELAELIAAIASRDGTAIELQVLQYGVTRQRLSEAIAAGGGWDVVHLAGHGARGVFLLDQPDGSADRVSTADLAGLLRPTQGRLKLPCSPPANQRRRRRRTHCDCSACQRKRPTPPPLTPAGR